MCRRGINRRPKLIPDGGKSLPQLVFELRQVDSRAEGMTDGGLLFLGRAASRRQEHRTMMPGSSSARALQDGR